MTELGADHPRGGAGDVGLVVGVVTELGADHHPGGGVLEGVVSGGGLDPFRGPETGSDIVHYDATGVISRMFHGHNPGCSLLILMVRSPAMITWSSISIPMMSPARTHRPVETISASLMTELPLG